MANKTKNVRFSPQRTKWVSARSHQKRKEARNIQICGLYRSPLSPAPDHRSCTGGAWCSSRAPCCARAASCRAPRPAGDLQAKQNVRALVNLPLTEVYGWEMPGCMHIMGALVIFKKDDWAQFSRALPKRPGIFPSALARVRFVRWRNIPRF